MKRILSFLAISLFILPIYAMVTAPSLAGRAGGESSSSYTALWKAEQKLEADGKPQSAYAAVLKILKKAEAEGRLGQAMSARLHAAGLRQEWAPDSFFTDIQALETLRAQEKRTEARAIYASILAEIYEQNRHRSQAKGLRFTSEDMKEWTREQYDSAATANWKLSLADIPALAQARSKEWLPFITQATNSDYFHHDLLHILWQRLREQRRQLWSAQGQEMMALGTAVKEEYIRQQNREAELLVALDLVNLKESNQSQRGTLDTHPTIDALQALKEQFADLPLCAEVILRLFQTDAPDSLREAWAKEALQRYPRYARIGEIKNELNALRCPSVSWTGNDVYYPGKTYTWKLTHRNATAVQMTIYRLKDSFKEEQAGSGKQSIRNYLKAHGTEVHRIERNLRNGNRLATVEDSFTWQAPGLGRYAILYTATTNEKEAVRKTATDQYHLFRVSALKTIKRTQQDGRLEVIVVDAMSGQPVEGAEAKIEVIDYDTEKRTLYASSKSNAEGRVMLPRLANNERRSTELSIVKGEDRWLPAEHPYTNSWISSDEKQTAIHLYTDRAIYRPGQTVHVSGIVYTKEHWDAAVMSGQTYELLLRDANWKEVGKQSAKTDSMGVFAADFVLPEGGLPGYYHVQTNGGDIGFRVEEYKRPTFEVTMDEAPALQWPQDSITLTGKAIGYNGVPVRMARVTGHYQFTYPYRWWYRHDDSPRQPIDTIQTDNEGVFHVRVPLNHIPADALRYGLNLSLNVEVLNAAGETHEGSCRVPLCTTPLRLSITMAEQQERSRIQPPFFSLITSTGKPAEGTITCTILPVGHDEAVMSDVSSEEIKHAISTLPSGDYELRAFAQAGSDTASAKARFYLFSMTDTRLPRHADKWLYCPTDSFDAEHPAHIQVGSSFQDVALYYSLVGPEGAIKDELLSISDELRTIEVPYQADYGDGVTAYFAFVKEGHCYTMSQPLKLTMPDQRLRWEWTSFRDRLHPGQQETWTLRLTKPDGTPANANLMATIYDASLDQLTPHAWNLLVSRSHHLRTMPWRSNDFFRFGNAFEYLNFTMKNYPVKDLAFDAVDETWTSGLSFGTGNNLYFFTGKSVRRAARTNGAVMEEAAMVGAPVPAPMAATREFAGGVVMAKNQAAIDGVEYDNAESEEDGIIAGLNIHESEKATVPSPALRTDFNETAAFMPRLHSNPTTGEVSLSFTLPESLTTWQLLGVAHTSDMMTADIQAQAVARKELMASLHLPRFLRAGDESSIRATVQNLTAESHSGTALLEIFDPETEKIILKKKVHFTTAPQGETVLAFDYTPTEETPIVAVRLTATTTPLKKKDASFSDGEQHYLPILSAKEWVTESIEIQADSMGVFTTDLSSLFNNDSPTATQRRLTVEYTTHPIWNVVQALPTLREPQHDDILSLTSAFYANALAAHIASTTPRLQEIISLWKQQGANPSPLANNEELKQMILDETPWLREASNDSQRRAQLIDLFNANLIESRIDGTLQRLAQRQEADGGFAWFQGMHSSELMTRLVCIELTHLRHLTGGYSSLTSTASQQANSILRRAFAYIAKENARMIKEMKKAESKGATINTAHRMHLDYIYITQRAGVQLTKDQKADVRYLLDHLQGSMASMSNDERAMAAIVLHGDGRSKEAQLYFDSMREHLTTTSAHGTFFDYAGGSFTPTGHKISVHATAMEAVRELGSKDKRLNNGLRRWLLQQKRTQMWESSICTIDAIYALLSDAADNLESTAKDKLTLNYGRRKVTVSANAASPVQSSSPAALGYIRETYTDGAAPKSITVHRNSTSEAWGAVYAQYLTPIAEATAHTSGLSVRQEFSSQTPRLGDQLTTRYIISADRDFEYVCLRTPRAAAVEPAEQLSGYRYQGGLGYYHAVHDAHTDYFFSHLPKGTYVIEEKAFIDRTGHYASGITSIQCLYAPEYRGNATSTELMIK